MRVLLVSHTYISEANRRKIYALAEESPDIRLRVVTPRVWDDLSFNPQSETKNGRVEFVALGSALTGHESAYFYVKGLGKVISEFRPDIIQVEHGEYALSYYQVLRLKERFSPQAKCVFFTWNNLRPEHNFLRRAIENYNLRHTDMAFAGNGGAMHLLRERGFDRSIQILPQLGVDEGVFRKHDVSDLRARLKLTDRVIGYAGQFTLEKGLLTLILAASYLKEHPWQLLMVGSGKLEDDIKCLAEEEGILDRLRIVRPTSRQEMADYLCCMDMLVLPSETTPFWMEQFNYRLIEAMASEVPVIGSNSSVIPELIGDAGLIFKEGCSRELSSAIHRLLTDQALATRLREAGRKRVLQHFTHQSIARRTYESYKQLLS